MPWKVHSWYCFFAQPFLQSIYWVIVFQMEWEMASKLTTSHIDLSIPCIVQFWYWFAFTTIFSVHLWSYSIPNGKWPQNWRFCILTSILPKCWHLLQLSELLLPIYAMQSPFLVLVCLHNHFIHYISRGKVLQMQTWLQNRRFCIFDLHFVNFRLGLHLYYPIHICCGIYILLIFWSY